MNNQKKFLIAINDTVTSDNALNYAAEILGSLVATEICLLHIYPEPPPDYYRSGKSLDDYKQDKEGAATGFIQRVRDILQTAGIEEQSIISMFRMADHATISQTILDTQTEGEYGTVIVGKRGVSKAEEFLFGSISSALIHNSKDCAVWVVG